jgi:hypothetical protein
MQRKLVMWFTADNERMFDLLLWSAGSTDRCNTLSESLSQCFKV